MTYHNPDQRNQFYLERLEALDGRCEICGNKERLVIDHDHRTGALRGLLCYRHNMGMGMFQDNPIVLEKAAGYLRQAGTTGENWIPKRKRPRITAQSGGRAACNRIAMTLIGQTGFRSDRARARQLAQETGCSYSAAQARIVRLRKSLETVRQND